MKTEWPCDYAVNLAGKLDAHLMLLHVIQSIPWGGVDMGVTLPYTYAQDLEAAIDIIGNTAFVALTHEISMAENYFR